MVRIIALLFLSIVLLGCQHSDVASQASDQLDNSFPSLQDYSLEQFQLSGDYDYWELRLSTQAQESSNQINPVAFDTTMQAQLTELQLERLNLARSHYDQLMTCEAVPCSYYALALSGEQVTVIDSQDALLALLGSIDTSAELHLWLWANRLAGESYEEVYGGYLVVVDGYHVCNNTAKNLLLVKNNGEISKRDTLGVDSRDCYQVEPRMLLVNNP